MQLTIATRQVGNVAILRCAGRIVAGPEVKHLQTQVTDLIPGPRHIVLQLAEVVFLDSSGMGTLVRLLTRLKSEGIRLGLCAVSSNVQRALEVTNLLNLFDVYASEEEAVSAAYSGARESELSSNAECVLCIGDTADIRVYMGAVVKAAGYQPLTCGSLYDAKILLNAGKPKLIIVKSELQSEVKAVAKELKYVVPVITLGDDFASKEASDASEELVGKIRGLLHSDTH